MRFIESIYKTDVAERLKGKVGSVIVHFVQCEYWAALLVDCLTKSNSGMIIFENHNRTSKRIEEFKKTLMRRKNVIKGEHLTEVCDWLDELEKMREERNGIVHSAWIPFAGLNDYERQLVKNIGAGKRKVQRTKMSAKELARIETQIVMLHSKGFELFMDVFPFKVRVR